MLSGQIVSTIRSIFDPKLSGVQLLITLFLSVLCTNGMRKPSSHLVGLPFLAVKVFFPCPEKQFLAESYVFIASSLMDGVV